MPYLAMDSFISFSGLRVHACESEYPVRRRVRESFLRDVFRYGIGRGGVQTAVVSKES